MKVLQDFGFGSLNLKAEDFLLPENVVQLGYEPYRIDLLVDVEGAEFLRCFDRRVEAKLDGVIVNFLCIQDLITIKKKT